MTDATQEQQQTPDEAQRRAILDEVLNEAAFEGFTRQTLTRSAQAAGVSSDKVSAGLLERLFPRGIADVLAYWSEQEDRHMAEAFAALNPKPHRLTEKITWLIKQRIEQLDWHREAARRAAATMALPSYGGLGAKLIWRTADTMWRAVEDKSTDFNWYTKRLTLSAVYGSTISHWFSDEGDAAAEEPYASTWAFLDARIGNLMQFEKAKAKALKAAPDPEAIVGFLGRLRYGSNPTKGSRL